MELCKIDGYKTISNDVKYLFKLRSLPDHTIVFENHLSIITILNSGFNSRFIVRLKENLIKLQEGL